MGAGINKPVGRTTTDGAGYWGCGRKQSYSKRTAIAVARKLRKRLGEPIHHYRCQRCGDWHIGHTPGTRTE